MPKRVDGNQSQIVSALRSLGASVQHLHTVGQGCPDILVGYRGCNYLLEIKDGKGRMTPDEQQWHENWGGSVKIVRNAVEAIEAVGIRVWRFEE